MKLFSGYCLLILILKFSVSSTFIVILACSNLSTSFRKSISGSRIEDGCFTLLVIAIFQIYGV